MSRLALPRKKNAKKLLRFQMLDPVVLRFHIGLMEKYILFSQLDRAENFLTVKHCWNSIEVFVVVSPKLHYFDLLWTC